MVARKEGLEVEAGGWVRMACRGVVGDRFELGKGS